MDIKSKVISVALVPVIALTLTGQVFAGTSSFSDLTNAKAKDKIIALQEKGYVHGVGNGKFAPDTVMTAGEGVALIVNAMGLNIDTVRFFKEPKATDYFRKANNDAWYANTLIVAAVNDMELPSDLDPNQDMTHEEYTYYLIQAMEKYGHLPKIKLAPVEITDQDQMTISFSGAIQRALVYGVAKLDAAGNFNPKGKISRADAAEQIYNVLEYLKAHPVLVD